MTGSIGSGLICYIVPIVNHVLIYFGKSRAVRRPSDEHVPVLHHTCSDLPSRLQRDSAGDELLLGLLDRESIQLDPSNVVNVATSDDFVYPLYADKARTTWSTMIHVFLPLVVLLVGICTSLALIADFPYT